MLAEAGAPPFPVPQDEAEDGAEPGTPPTPDVFGEETNTTAEEAQGAHAEEKGKESPGPGLALLAAALAIACHAVRTTHRRRPPRL